MILWLLVRYWNFCFNIYVWYIPLLYGILPLCTVPPLLHAVMSTAITLWGRWRKRRWQKRRDIWLLQENLPATYTVIVMTANFLTRSKIIQMKKVKKKMSNCTMCCLSEAQLFFLKKICDVRWLQRFLLLVLLQTYLQKCMLAKNFVKLLSVHMLNWP